MANPPFIFDATDPADNAIVSAFPANERVYRDMVYSMLGREHDFASGHHEFGIGTSAQRDAITDWVNGACWYNTDLSTLQIRVTAAWVSVSAAEPAGTVKSYIGTTAPNGYLLCDGSAVSRTTYSALFAVANTTFGAGDGSTTFNVPDLRGRVVAGLDGGTGRITDLGTSALGLAGGEQHHALTTAELAAHSHGVTDPGHTHSVPNALGSTAGAGNFWFNSTTPGVLPVTSAAATGISVQNAGSGNAHNNIQPTILLNYIVKT